VTQLSRPRFALFNTEERILHSESAGQDFQIGIWLPFGYASSDERYPVLYVPDGEFAFGLATGLIPTLIGTGEVPNMLVVGIAYQGITSWREHGILRDRILCPPGFQEPPGESRINLFSSVLRQELFPLVEAEYRGSPSDRTVFGFSAGGLFALHTMLTQPGMFRRYIAASCTWSGADDYLLNCEQAYALQSVHLPENLYLAVGGLEEDQLPGFQRLVATFQGRNYHHLRLFTQVFEGEKHSAGVLAKAFLYGMRAVWAR
jgi:predicted alpha/beta superfamily hydrolase